MSSKTPIGYIDLRVFAHATEDEEKVLTSVRNTLPEEMSHDIIFQKYNLSGHHGNPIFVFETKLMDKQALPLVLDKLGKNMNSLDKETLMRDLKLHLEKRNLYLRFDKQAAYLDKLRFTSTDPIHFKIHFKNKSPEEIVEICKKTGLLP